MSKLLKVVMEFEGYTQVLEGEIAQKWLDAVNSMCVMGHVHGQPFPKFDWNKKNEEIKDGKQLEFNFGGSCSQASVVV